MSENQEVSIVQVIIALFLPPLAVFLKAGAGKDLIINIVATVLFFVPGVLHALYTVIKK